MHTMYDSGSDTKVTFDTVFVVLMLFRVCVCVCVCEEQVILESVNL